MKKEEGGEVHFASSSIVLLDLNVCERKEEKEKEKCESCQRPKWNVYFSGVFMRLLACVDRLKPRGQDTMAAGRGCGYCQ